MVPGCLETVLDDAALLGTAVGEPATEGQDRDLQTAWAEVAKDLFSFAVSHLVVAMRLAVSLTMSFGSNLETGMCSAIVLGLYDFCWVWVFGKGMSLMWFAKKEESG